MLFVLINVYYAHIFYGVHVTQSLVFCVLFCRSLFVLLAHCLCFDLRHLITPLVS